MGVGPGQGEWVQRCTEAPPRPGQNFTLSMKSLCILGYPYPTLQTSGPCAQVWGDSPWGPEETMGQLPPGLGKGAWIQQLPPGPLEGGVWELPSCKQAQECCSIDRKILIQFCCIVFLPIPLPSSSELAAGAVTAGSTAGITDCLRSECLAHPRVVRPENSVCA